MRQNRELSKRSLLTLTFASPMMTARVFANGSLMFQFDEDKENTELGRLLREGTLSHRIMPGPPVLGQTQIQSFTTVLVGLLTITIAAPIILEYINSFLNGPSIIDLREPTVKISRRRDLPVGYVYIINANGGMERQPVARLELRDIVEILINKLPGQR